MLNAPQSGVHSNVSSQHYLMPISIRRRIVQASVVTILLPFLFNSFVVVVLCHFIFFSFSNWNRTFFPRSLCVYTVLRGARTSTLINFISGLRFDWLIFCFSLQHLTTYMHVVSHYLSTRCNFFVAFFVSFR